MDFSDIKWIEFDDIIDDRGRLTAIESDKHIPFKIQRVFYVYQVNDGMQRGGHAHLETDQVISVVHGTLDILLTDGIHKKKYHLSDSTQGLFVPRNIWIVLGNFSKETICIVFANTKYDRKKTIKSWEQYISINELYDIDNPQI